MVWACYIVFRNSPEDPQQRASSTRWIRGWTILETKGLDQNLTYDDKVAGKYFYHKTKLSLRAHSDISQCSYMLAQLRSEHRSHQHERILKNSYILTLNVQDERWPVSHLYSPGIDLIGQSQGYVSLPSFSSEHLFFSELWMSRQEFPITFPLVLFSISILEA